MLQWSGYGNDYVTILDVAELRGYINENGILRFAKWFDELDPAAAVRVTIALTRIGEGNLSNVKSVGSGVYECKIDFGPGYRIYFGKDGDRIIVLLGGGTKKRQRRDIESAKNCWADYKRRKKLGETGNASYP